MKKQLTASKDTPGLNPAQQLAAQAPGDPLLIVAGAGTGKTLALTHRLFHIIESGAAPQSICALTFTNKAARAMFDRALKLLSVRGLPQNTVSSFAVRPPFIGTLHSFGVRILREEGGAFGRSKRFIIFDDDDSFRLLKKCMKAFGADPKKTPPGRIFQNISDLKSGKRTPKDFTEKKNHEGALTLSVLESYEQGLREHNAFDFDDLIQKTVALLRENSAARGRLHARYAHILVDEYQDINNAQYELIALLARREGQSSISVVGDDQQMIYSWRGSNINIFLNFERDWEKSRIVFLEQNYRSTPQIINAASAMIANNIYQKPKTLWTRNPDGPPVRVVEATDETAEAEWVADQLTGGNPDDSESTAILYRTNAQSRAIEQALIAREIPYRIFGGTKFYERREIKDIVAALRIALNPKDSLSRERLEKNLTKSRFLRLREALGESAADASPATLIETFLSATRYREYLEERFTNPSERRENIASLLRFASEFPTLDALLEQIALVQSTDDPNAERAEAPRVSLMTIHLAKGLEFDRVFIVGASEGLLPHARSQNDDRELEEERRLMYVAMTRAKKYLCIVFCDVPSRFLFEIPPEYTEFSSLSSDSQELADDEERYITVD